jgi:hypothetical protein
MKNKILALVLALIIALSSTSAFAAEQVYYTNFNIYDLLRNYGSYYFEPADTNGNVQTNTYTEKAPVDYTAETNQAPSNERATSETRTNTSAAPSVSNYERVKNIF